MEIEDQHRLPLAVGARAANHHEVSLVQLSFDYYMIEAKRHNLISDRAYDSDKLDEQLKQDVTKSAKTRSPRDQDRVGYAGVGQWWVKSSIFQ